MIKVRGIKKIYWCDFYTATGERVRESLHTQDKQEARELEAKLIASTEKRTQERSRGGITLKEAFTHAMRVRDEWRSAKSLHSINQIYGTISRHFGEDCYLADLDDDRMLEYGEELWDTGLTASTINKRFSLVAVLFDEAIQWKKFHGRKPNTVRYKVKNGRRRLISIVEEKQVLSILRASASPWEHSMADLIVVLADTGLRLSEALTIDPRNIQGNSVMVVDTKTGDDRAVPLTSRAQEVLTRLSQEHTDNLFQPLTRSTISHIWRRVRAKMGLANEPEFVLHAFRHTYGSTLANAGVDAFRIQKAMGHKVIATTQRYVKVASSALDGLADIMQNRCDQKCDQNVSKTG